MEDSAQRRLVRGRSIFDRVDPTGGDALLSQLSEVAPDFAELVLGFVYGDIYDRSTLPLRERQLIRLAVLAALDPGPTTLRANIGAAVHIGIPAEHIAEVFIQCLPYIGFPRVINALTVAQQFLADTDSPGDGASETPEADRPRPKPTTTTGKG
ncbi:carboxymuconolactone decarboxylase family protein [Amycolatopsis speibonae]|uniref:Carboxymuconolactone decarboxylase family protein n=1 Tax=Amycolatopsis speibonae TaxID=1450224 RepID=A0ABV7P4H5_9PSEU